METISHDGRTTAYRRGGGNDGPTICYVHGAGGTSRVWVHQYADRRLPPAVAVDLSGHGESDDVSTTAGPETLDAYADDVVAVCEATSASVLCGNSMGGAVALWIALERDIDLEGLVLVDTGARLSVDPDFLETIASDFEGAIETLHAPGIFFRRPTDDLVDASVECMRSVGQAVTRRDFETSDCFDVRDRLDEIDTPALALCGEHDRMTPPEFHEHLAESMPDCTYQSIEDASHLSMLERPQHCNDAIRTFLELSD